MKSTSKPGVRKSNEGADAVMKAGIDPHERVAALADSALDDDEAQAAIDQLLQSPELCAAWHRLHRTSDYLRSDEMADCDAGVAFWDRFSARLEDEPTILAPNRTRRSQRPWLRYGVAGASAAAMVALIGWIIIPEQAGESPRGTVVATKSLPTVQPAAQPASQPAFQPPTSQPTMQPQSTRMVAQSDVAPDASLATASQASGPVAPVDQKALRAYLAAHQQFSASALRGPVAVQSASFNTMRVDDPVRR